MPFLRRRPAPPAPVTALDQLTARLIAANAAALTRKGN